MIDRIERSLTTLHVGVDEDDVDEIVSAINAGSLAGNAPVVDEYERLLERQFGTSHAIAYANGTVSLQGALRAAGVGRGDEVALPPTCPVMTALPILNLGASPVFVDTKSHNSFSICPHSLRERLTPDTKAIISIPMWGYPTKIGAVNDIAAERGTVVIEDAAQAHGATIGDDYVGTNADIGSFSTHQQKVICTGEGGFLLTDSDELARKVAELRSFGICYFSRREFADHSANYGDRFGMNYKFNAMGAAMGIAQLDKFSSKLERRRTNAEYLMDQLAQENGPREIPTPPEHSPNYYALVLESRDPDRSGSEISDRLVNYNVVSDTYAYNFKPLFEYPLFSEYRTDCPNAEALTKRIFTVPTHEGLDRSELDYIIDSVLEADSP
ncbi:DegT/DnrJ/EryC1/StrS aminotransferase family protein [Natrarchaeobius oligotrophus]|uniref:DegT/DnrJ/EryC1/StrS family aminotransferase n=1 Tax=Natrarchaeobius chitinivorans TaxID=1679083 RepID=A0A3N6PG57_NATCH|nr:DegT/DnrJ/EryC1/StrS family aminotransferase [Natrarchaeobius chitinivorans]RQG99199.1 DegT/DnrJ/EryC1/StrS family aminotransferase [Natrarchaeobius chitinivorans]